jgi:hypothetical protein
MTNNSVKLTTTDVTWKDLTELGKKKGIIEFFLEFLHKFWVGENKKRETDVRIGNIDFIIDDNGFLHFDFVTRFHLNKDQIEKLKKTFEGTIPYERYEKEFFQERCNETL